MDIYVDGGERARVDQRYVLHHHTGYWVAIIMQRSELLAEGAGVDVPHGGGGGLEASCREENWGGRDKAHHPGDQACLLTIQG